MLLELVEKRGGWPTVLASYLQAHKDLHPTVDGVDTSEVVTGGLSCETCRIRVQFRPLSQSVSFIVKYKRNIEGSLQLGLWREAFFLWYVQQIQQEQAEEGSDAAAAAHVPSAMAGFIRRHCARVWFAWSDPSTGATLVVMEDLKHTYALAPAAAAEGSVAVTVQDTLMAPLGYFFGKHSPLHWGDTHETIDAGVLRVMPDAYAAGAEITDEARLAVEKRAALLLAQSIGRYHGATWGWPATTAAIEDIMHRATTTVTSPYASGAPLGNAVRGLGWIASSTTHTRESWEAAIDYSKNSWTKGIEKHGGKSRPDGRDVLSAELVRIVEKMTAATSWDRMLEVSKTLNVSCIHGDCHPGNFFARRSAAGDASTVDVVALDFEAVGVGNGPCELAEALISHANPAHRRLYELELVNEYINVVNGEQARLGGVAVDSAKVHREYAVCGFGRFVWFMMILAAYDMPLPGYFADQLMAFFEDHTVVLAESLENNSLLIRP